MSGLKNVLGNVYGDPNDRPQKANLDDVKESMDALTEHADEAQGASEEQLSAGAVDANVHEPVAESDIDETIGDFGAGTDDDEEESPWAMLDELPNLTENPASLDEPSATESNHQEIASEEPDSEVSWLSEVQDDHSSEDWLNDYDESGWTGSKQNETPSKSIDDSNDVDELANFDFAAIEDSTDEASVEALVHGSVREATSSTAKSFTDLPSSGDSRETSATDAGDLDPDQEAWLDDLFSLDDESEDETAVEDQTSPKTDSVEPIDPKAQPAQRPEASVPVIEETASLAPEGLDAVSAMYSASDQKFNPHLDTLTPIIDAPAGGFYGGWTRIDDDILPQKKSGRGRKKAEIAIAPDSQRMAQSQNRSMTNDVDSISAEPQNAAGDHTHLVEANFENALLEGFTDHDSLVNESSETAPQLPEPAANGGEVPGFDQPLLQSSEELDPSDSVHLFAHDEALEEAATAGGRRKARKQAAKQAKVEKAEVQAEQLDSASDSSDSSAEPAPELNRKAKAAAAKTARAEKALAKKAAAKQAKAEKARTRDASRDRKGRSPKNKDDHNDEALRAQVDAALAAQVATNNGHGSDDFWADDAAVPAAEVTPSAPAGMADPLDTELVSPPPAPVEGIDPGPVLD